MIAASRRWLRRNRTPIAIGLGVVGAGYVATQYVLNKITDAKERMSGERLARENLRRRFEQNQEDCTFTVLALLPTVTENVLTEMRTEEISYKIQQHKTIPSAKITETSAASEIGSDTPTATDDDGRSVASTTESGVHASRVELPSVGLNEKISEDVPLSAQDARKLKLRLWHELKISAITRALTLLYTLTLLTIFTRIQLNLLGRMSYLSSIYGSENMDESPRISLHDNDSPSRTPPMPLGADFATNRQYLTFSWYLLNRGWRIMSQRIEAAVHAVVGNIPITDSLTLQQFSAFIIDIRRRVEVSSEDGSKYVSWLDILLPCADEEVHVLRQSGILAPFNEPTATESLAAGSDESADILGSSSVSPNLRGLLDETADIIDSPTFTHVLTLLLDAGFSMLIDDKLASLAFGISDALLEAAPLAHLQQAAPDSSDRTVPPTTSTLDSIIPNPRSPLSSQSVKLPKILAPLTRQAHVIGSSSISTGDGNIYLKAMEAVGDLDAFAAVVYAGPTRREDAARSTVQTDWKGAFDSPAGAGVGPGVTGEYGEHEADVSLSMFESAWGKASATSAWEKASLTNS